MSWPSNADLTTSIATVDLEDVRSYRSSKSRALQATKQPSYERVEVEMSLSNDPEDVDLLVRPSLPSDVRFYTPEEEISLGPACWLWDYLRRSKQVCLSATQIMFPSYLHKRASTDPLAYRRDSFSHFQEVCPILRTSLFFQIIVIYTCGTFSTPVVDPKSVHTYQGLLGIDSCATAVIVHSMCRLVHGDIAEGKKLVNFGEIFLWRKPLDPLIKFTPALY